MVEETIIQIKIIKSENRINREIIINGDFAFQELYSPIPESEDKVNPEFTKFLQWVLIDIKN